MTTRRDFLKTSGAVVLAFQLPSPRRAEAEPYTKALRREVIFVYELPADFRHWTNDPRPAPPPNGTIVAGEVEGEQVLYHVIGRVNKPVIDTVGLEADPFGTPGRLYGGYCMQVEAVCAGPVPVGPINRIVTPNTGYCFVRENWWKERSSYDPGFVPARDIFW